MSRLRRVGEDSAAVKWDIRVDSGGDVALLGSGSGSGRVRARAMLQAFAPRSRTWGKWRLISCQLFVRIEIKMILD
jgi:hypothetical protein